MPKKDEVDPELKELLDAAADAFCQDEEAQQDALTVRYWEMLLRRAEKIQAPGPRSLAMEVAKKHLEIARAIQRDRPMAKKAEDN